VPDDEPLNVTHDRALDDDQVHTDAVVTLRVTNPPLEEMLDASGETE
jgi:transcription initiation factor IIF auxiliary subunit